jgi:anti-sigma B factor antagonist
VKREERDERTLHSSLHVLRLEHEALGEANHRRRMDMPQAQVTMDVRKVDEKASVIDIRGELTGFAEGALMEAYEQAGSGSVRAIILNFEGLEYMNSSGIGLLVTLLIRVNREKQRLLTYGLTEHYRHIFELTRLDEAIGIHDSEEEAVRAAKAG